MAKEYPPSMCRAIALACCDAIVCSRDGLNPIVDMDDLCKDFDDLTANFIPYQAETALGSDCMLFGGTPHRG